MKARIKSVSFRSCVMVGRFQTVHIEASSDVPVGMRAESVLNDLKLFVAKELARAAEGETVQVVETKKTGAFEEVIAVQRLP